MVLSHLISNLIKDNNSHIIYKDIGCYNTKTMEVRTENKGKLINAIKHCQNRKFIIEVSCEISVFFPVVKIFHSFAYNTKSALEKK